MTQDDTTPGVEVRLGQLDSRMKVISGQQANILSALSMILDTLRAQSKILQQLSALARDEPSSSPLLDSLNDLTTAVVAMDGSVQTMSGRLDGLPEAIGTELGRRRWQTPMET
jgi:hypothetical protein